MSAKLNFSKTDNVGETEFQQSLIWALPNFSEASTIGKAKTKLCLQ
jgi:hypothetical protein